MRWEMGDEELRRWVRQTLERLDGSSFRAGFTLSAKDRAYALAKGEATIREHARDLLEGRIGSAFPARDGKQTPYRGHPVFTAQHATATCCRGCVEKWHHIPKGRPLTNAELDDLTELVVRWIRRDIVRHERMPGRTGGGCSTSSKRGLDLDQHFLTNPAKIDALLAAADIGPHDRVAELGAGIGSVAARMPSCEELTLVELDPSLCTRLRERFAESERVRVVQADAIAWLGRQGTTLDVVVSNLPAQLTDRVLATLARTPHRSAVVSMKQGECPTIPEELELRPVCTLEEDDFEPRQPFATTVCSVRRADCTK